jgi:phospholipid/cholesterol/gamma-HCH transport system ATP-binding protein
MADDTEKVLGEPIIECEHLDCGYPTKTVLEDVNITINRGEIVALLGGSGCGKSTLMRTIVGLLRPLGGDVRMFGVNLHDMEEEDRGPYLQRTGMLFQYGALFGSKTILDNIALPLREHTNLPEPVIREMVLQKLALVGLEGLEQRLPSDVSGGQRKRVALARATIMDPEIVFCDEPSAGLDPIVAAGLDQTLRHFQELFGMTMVVVTHELESIKILCDRVIMLEGGRVLAVGTIEEMFQSDIPEVHNFFHRIAPDYAAEGMSVMDTLEFER